jgi:sugar phosphate isomerase/epimerase
MEPRIERARRVHRESLLRRVLVSSGTMGVSCDPSALNRRHFIEHWSVAAASVAFCNLGARVATAAECDPPLGVQLYTIRDELQRDPLAALARLGEIGFTQAELYGLSGQENGRLFGLTASELKRAFAANALTVELAQIDGSLTNTAATNTAAIADFAAELAITTAIVGLPSEFTAVRGGRFERVPAKGRAQLDALAEKLDRAARDYRARGIGFGYHNHDVELVQVDGVVPLDYLMSRTDPGLVKMELDLGWLALAGADPAEYIRRYSGRVVACHMKDYGARIRSDAPERKLVEPGAGAIDFAAVLTAMRDAKVAHAFIEIDEPADPFGAVERGYRHLQTLLGCG